MTPTQKLAALQRWHDVINNSAEHLNALDKLMGLEPEGGLRTAVHAVQNALTDATAELVGDVGGWLDWHRFDNEMGARGRTVSHKTEQRTIADLVDLLWAIDGTEPTPPQEPAA
jgi:hypothetical protein